MAILPIPVSAAFDNTTAATGSASGSTTETVTVSFSPGALKTVFSLKLNGTFDAASNIQNLTGAVYTTPDGAIFSISLPFFQPTTPFDLAASSLRVDRLWGVVLSGDDWFSLGAQADNVSLHAGDDYVDAGGGNDLITGGAGNDTLNGNTGIDTAVYTGTRAGFSVARSGDNYSATDLTGAEGVDTLTNVERMRFADTSVAIDMNGAAGMTAKILGAVFGPSAIQNKTYAGIGLKLFDAGQSYAQVTQLAINEALGPAHTSQDLVNLLYRNVTGVLPVAAELNRYVGMLQTGVYTEVTLTQAAGDLINLVGVAQGLEYTPQA